MSEKLAWQTLAKDMFSAAGDIVFDCAIEVVAPGAFDKDKGAPSQVTTSTSTKAFEDKKSRDFTTKMGSSSASYKCYRILGLPLSSAPKAGCLFVQGSIKVRVDEVENDDLGVGATYLVYVKG